MRSSTRSITKLLAFVLIGCAICSDATGTSSAPPPTETSDIEVIFQNVTLEFKNVPSITPEDMDAMFGVQKEWFESYFRQGERRELQTIRDSSDMTAQYELVAQASTTGADGKPGTKITYNIKIGFLPSSVRKLIKLDVEVYSAVRRVVMSPYLDDPALLELDMMIRERGGASFSTLRGLSFTYHIGPPPTAATAPPPEETPSPDVEIVYDDETIDFINVESAPLEDIEAMFTYMKDWFESYYREQPFRHLRGLQRRRDSRDVSTQFGFERQSVSTNASGKPVNTVTYSQTIGFTPSRRNLFEVNVDNRDEVYGLVTNIFKDEAALQDLAMTLRMNVGSFSSLEGISKMFDNMTGRNPGDGGNAPPPAETSEIEVVFRGATLEFKNVPSITTQDMDVMFGVQKDWFESYFRQGQQRKLQTIRDSSDMTAQYELVTQASTTGANGKPGTKITYNIKIGFLPSTRRLVQVNVEDFRAVYQVVMSPYLDDPTFLELATMIRESGAASFTTLEGLSFAYRYR